MNVRSFTDLDDILIDSSGIVEDNYGEDTFVDDTYADDFEDDDREKSRSGIGINNGNNANGNDKRSPPDRGTLDKELDEGKSIVADGADGAAIDFGVPYVDEGDDLNSVRSSHSNSHSNSSRSLDDVSHGSGMIMDQRETEKLVSSPAISPNSPDSLQKENVSSVSSNSPTITAPPSFAESEIPKKPTIRSNLNTVRIRGGGFSRVSAVNPIEIQKLRGTQKLPEAQSQVPIAISNVDNSLLVRQVQDLLVAVNARSVENQERVKMLQRRSVPVQNINHGLCTEEVQRLDAHRSTLGVDEYDPDYRTAVAMSQEQRRSRNMTLPGPCRSDVSSEVLTSKPNIVHLPSRSNPPIWSAQFTSTSDPNYYQHEDEEGLGPNVTKPKQQYHRNDATVITPTFGYDHSTDDSLLNYINDEPESAMLLRLGVNREVLADMADRVHSQFIFQLIQQCRSAADGATSIEELAMHKLLLDKVTKTFASSGIRKLRGELIAAAAEASLTTTKHK